MSDYVSGQLRDLLDNGDIDLPVLREAGLVDSDAHDILLRIKRHSPDGTDDDRFQRILERELSKNVREGVVRGHTPALNHLTGLSSNSVDATGYQMLLKACRPAAQQVLLKGPKGSGKTTKAFDLIRRLHSDFDGELRVMTNVEGPDEHEDVEFAEDISRYLEFAKAPGEKVALFDEFSTVGNAYTGQQDVEQVMSRVINAFRKSEGGSLRTMYIGHENDNDIHPLVKKQSDVVIQADGKVDEGLIDNATVYRGWSDYKSDEDWFNVHGLEDVPSDSPWSFSTNYFAHLEWNLDQPEEQIQRGQLIEDWEKYQEGDDAGDEEDEELAVCGHDGCKATSEQYPVIAEEGFCPYHDPDDADDDEGDVEELVDGLLAAAADEMDEEDAEAVVDNLQDGARVIDALTDDGDEE